MNDKVFPLKFESSATGGTEDDQAPTSLDAREDGVVMKELWLVSDEADPKTQEIAQGIKTDASNNIVVYDRNTGPKTLSELAAGGSVQQGTSRPLAVEASRGLVYLTTGGTGVADVLEVCVKTAEDTYVWKDLFNAIIGGS